MDYHLWVEEILLIVKSCLQSTEHLARIIPQGLGKANSGEKRAISETTNLTSAWLSSLSSSLIEATRLSSSLSLSSARSSSPSVSLHKDESSNASLKRDHHVNDSVV